MTLGLKVKVKLNIQYLSVLPVTTTSFTFFMENVHIRPNECIWCKLTTKVLESQHIRNADKVFLKNYSTILDMPYSLKIDLSTGQERTSCLYAVCIIHYKVASGKWL